jgi:hypothetical protein
MKRPVFPRGVFLAITAALVLAPDVVLACAVCFGKSDAPMARGMNMGIFTLLGVITAVLLGVASFFVFLARRSARVPAELEDADAEETVSRS